MSAPEGRDRRAIPQRSSRWASRAADLLARARLTPNQLSVGSVLVSVAGAGALLASADAPAGARAALLIVAAVCAPVRLLLNMLDGMLAVEKGLRSPTGELFNEVPDRIADVVFLAAAGYAAGMPALGWTAASLALLTAYVAVAETHTCCTGPAGGALQRCADRLKRAAEHGPAAAHLH